MKCMCVSGVNNCCVGEGDNLSMKLWLLWKCFRTDIGEKAKVFVTVNNVQ